MTSPGGGGFKIAEGYVEVGLKDDTAADARRIERSLRHSLPGKAYIPVEAKLVNNAGPGMKALRDQLYELRKASKITATYESRQVMDEMGRYHTRYFKVSQDSGTFIGEVMSKHMMKSMSKMVRHPGLFGPIIGGLLGGMGAAIQAGVPGLIGNALNEALLKSNAGVKISSENFTRQFENAIERAATNVNADDAIARMYTRMSNAADGLRSPFENTFRHIPALADRASAGVLQAIRNAAPGIERVMSTSFAAVDGLSDGLETAGTGVTRFFNNLSSSAPQAGQVFRTFGVVLSDVLAMSGQVMASFTNLFGGQIWNEAEAVFGKLTSIVGNFVQGALPGLGTGLEVAMNILSGVLSVIQPIAGILGSWVGTILGVTVAIRGFSAAMGVMAALGALVKFTPITAAMSTLSLQAGNAGASLAAYTTRLTGSEAAGERVAGTTSRIVNGLSRVGNALPFIGAALAGAAILWDEFGSKAEESAGKAVTGSMTIQEAMNKEIAQVEKNQIFWWTATDQQNAHAAARQRVTDQIHQQLAVMDPLERAVAEAALAEGRYKDALQAQGANHPATLAAAQQLAAARQREEQETFQAEQATRGYTQALIDHTNWVMSQANADLNHRMSIHEQAKARRDAAAAVREHGASSDEAKEAQFRLEQADLRVIDATGRLASENRGLTTETDKSKAAADSQRASILEMASSATGRGNPALASMAAKFSEADVAAHNAAVKTSGFAYEVRTLPDGRRVLIAVDANRQPILDMQAAIRNTNSKTITLTVIERVQRVTTHNNVYGSGFKERAMGGLDLPMGRAHGFAAGGVAQSARGLNNKLATVIRPGDLRIVGDNPTYPELFVPLNRSRRSLNLLEAGAQHFDKQLVPSMSRSAVQSTSQSTSLPSSHNSSTSSTSSPTNNFYVTIDGKTVAEMVSIADFFSKVKQTARRGNSGVSI